MSAAPFRILFVCLGNICRSSTAEGVLRKRLEDEGLADRVEVASAGTAGYHVGDPPDPRTVAAARQRGYDLSRQRAQQLEAADFDRYDMLLAMDETNLANMRRLCPDQHQGKLGLYLDHASGYPDETAVPDPYYGGPDGFEVVLDMIEDASEGLLRAARAARP